MKNVFAYFSKLLLDPLFLRVIVVILAGGLIAGGLFWLGHIRPITVGACLFMLLPLAITAGGGYLLHAAVWGNDERFENATRYAGGGDLVSIVLLIGIGLIALPVVAVLRCVRKSKNLESK